MLFLDNRVEKICHKTGNESVRFEFKDTPSIFELRAESIRILRILELTICSRMRWPAYWRRRLLIRARVGA